MMVRMTRRPARVKPDWEVARLRGLGVSRCSRQSALPPRDFATPRPRNPASPALIRSPIQPIPHRAAVDVVDTRLTAAGGVGGGGVDRRARVAPGRIDGGGHLFPV